MNAHLPFTVHAAATLVAYPLLAHGRGYPINARRSPADEYVSSFDLSAQRDVALIESIRNGDQRAAAELYDRHSGMLLAIALRITGHQADAEEVVLDSLMQAWRDAVRFDATRATVAGWLTTIARTRALDLVRSRARRERGIDRVSAEAAIDDALLPTAPADPFRQIEDRESGEAVGSALASLPEPQRHAIELAFYDGLTHTEISERLAQPLGTIKTRIRLGMLKLREALAPIVSGDKQ